MNDDQPTQPLTDQPMRPEGGCSLAGPNGSRIPIEEPHSYSSHKGVNTIFVRTCDLCGDIDWDALHEATVERVAIEVSRLRAALTEVSNARDYLAGRVEHYIDAHEAATQRLEHADAKIERLQSQRDALVRKLGLDWGSDEFGDLDAAIVAAPTCGHSPDWSCRLGPRCSCVKIAHHGGRHKCACESWWYDNV